MEFDICFPGEVIYEGVDASGAWIFTDQNGDGYYCGCLDDYALAGNGLPDWSLGWQNTFRAGRFQMNFLIRGVFGHDLINEQRFFNNNLWPISSYNRLVSAEEPELAALTDPIYFSSYFIENASFLRMENITFSYELQIPKIRSLRLFLGIENLFTLTNYSGGDPSPRLEYGGNVLLHGVDGQNTYPQSRSILLGVEVGL